MPNHHLAIHLRSLLLAGLWLLTTACHADQPAWQGVWSGTIGKSEVRVCLDEKGKSAYRYQRYQKDIPLVLKGNQWQETSDGKVTGIWTLDNPQDDTLDGEWRSPKKGRSLLIHLVKQPDGHRSSPCDSLVYLTRGMVGVKPAGSMKETAATDEKSPDKISVANNHGQARGCVNALQNFLNNVVVSRDGKVFVAVGRGGAIERSTDGGASWSVVASGTANDLVKVFAGAPRVLVAVGGGGTIVRSVNDGASWAVMKSGTENMFTSILETSSGTLIVVGKEGTIVRSSDSGANWSVMQSGTENDLEDVATIPNGVLVSVGDWGTIVRSIDDGVSWSVAKMIDDSENQSSTAASHRAVKHSPKGSMENDNIFLSVIAVSNKVLVAVGDQGAIVRSTDGGANWSVVDSDTSDVFCGVIATPSGALVAMTCQNDIERSTDAGASWVMSEGSSVGYKSVTIGPSGVLVAVGSEIASTWSSGVIIRSIDDGVSWFEMKGPPDIHRIGFSSVIAAPDGALVAVGGGNDAEHGAIIVRSTDGGANWTEVQNTAVSNRGIWPYSDRWHRQ